MQSFALIGSVAEFANSCLSVAELKLAAPGPLTLYPTRGLGNNLSDHTASPPLKYYEFTVGIWFTIFTRLPSKFGAAIAIQDHATLILLS